MQKCLTTVFAFLLLAVSMVQAQVPAMTVKRAGEKPVILAGLDARVRIFGHLAETSMTMKFFNPNSRVLEGELEFPLPEGAVVSGYALDIDGELVEGVAVEKQKAREVLETEIRRGVDPGLVEKVKGNNFKTRVYPLNPSGYRIAQVIYLTELAVNDGEAQYRVPLHLSEKTENFNLRVEVLSADKQPKIVVTGAEPGEFSRMQSGWFSELSMQRQKIDSEIKVTIPVPEPGSVFVEQASDGNYYFSVQGLASDPDKSKVVKPAEKIVILYDASGSGAKRDLKLEKKFIEALFASDRVAAEVKVEFVAFRNRPGTPRSWVIRRGQADELLRHIDLMNYDGATSFSSISRDLSKPDCYLLLSDGISTYGKSLMPELDAPVYAVSSADGADYSFLQHVCRRTGGSLLNLKNLEVDRAVKLVGAAFFGIAATTYGKGIEEVFPTGKIAV
ncbi:MAG: VIT domain-containing protein, partial [Candidatus Riflebacteria bacterium]|nr:VIT domain-containing protein [Candidatus Riflebacteria bacterium]